MVSSVLKASALRAKYLTGTAYSKARDADRKAVVVGATSGIGEACAIRLAEQGYTVIAVGRDRPGRADAIVQRLQEASISSQSDEQEISPPKHEFRACDAFSLKSVDACAKSIVQDHPSIDALILSQGMATTQAFTPTKDEGNDEKLTLHYWSRMAMANGLLSSLRKSNLPGGSVVLSILSGGVHSPYAKYETDSELKENYSISNAANIAGFYNDLGFDYMARKSQNNGINFVHASPGFVNTNWGTEFPTYLRYMVRLVQPLGRRPSDCAEYMVGCTVLASDAGDALMPTPRPSKDQEGIYIMNENGQPKSLTNMHTPEARAFVWHTTTKVLRRAGIAME